MMTRRHLFRYVDAEPFQPFKIKMNSGEVFEIRHPEMVAISRTTAHVFTSIGDDSNGSHEREREISILLIESIEPLRRAATPGERED